jgi:hypothetical protein
MISLLFFIFYPLKYQAYNPLNKIAIQIVQNGKEKDERKGNNT